LRKGFDLFLQLWRAVARLSAAVSLAWIGDIDPALRIQLAAEIEAAEASGHFHLLGYREDAADFISAAEIRALTSREDPYPSVVLEAKSAGTPTIAFAGSGGIPEMLHAFGAGDSVPLGDVAAMAARALAMAPRVASGLAGLAETAPRHFSFADYAAGLLQLAQPGQADISVVVPSHNYARYLPQRLASIFAQSYPVREILLLDDASTDRSVAVAQGVAAGWGRDISIIAGAKNSGPVFRQWRRGAELAQGSLLWIAEADDTSESRFLERLVQAMQAAPDAVLAVSDSRAVDADGATLWPDHKSYYGAGRLGADVVFAARDFLRTHLAERNLLLNASAVLWRRSTLSMALEGHGEGLEEFRMAGDWRLYLEALDQAGAKICYVAEPLNIHRRHAKSLTYRLDPVRHLAEIAAMHGLLAARLNDAGLAERQVAWREQLAQELNPRPAASPPRQRRQGTGGRSVA
jgi:Glycosyl transferase family 2/Glycosyl transferases group 1